MEATSDSPRACRIPGGADAAVFLYGVLGLYAVQAAALSYKPRTATIPLRTGSAAKK